MLPQGMGRDTSYTPAAFSVNSLQPSSLEGFTALKGSWHYVDENSTPCGRKGRLVHPYI